MGQIAQRLSRIKPSPTIAVTQKARELIKGVGPKNILDAAKGQAFGRLGRCYGGCEGQGGLVLWRQRRDVF